MSDKLVYILYDTNDTSKNFITYDLHEFIRVGSLIDNTKVNGLSIPYSLCEKIFKCLLGGQNE